MYACLVVSPLQNGIVQSAISGWTLANAHSIVTNVESVEWEEGTSSNIAISAACVYPMMFLRHITVSRTSTKVSVY